MKVMPGRVVSLVYQITGEDGTRIDHAYSDAPLKYLHGHQHLVAGLDARLEGLGSQDRVDALLSGESVFGSPDDAEPLILPLESTDGVAGPRPGGGYLALVDGVERQLWIRAVHGDTIEATLAHPLAGYPLRVDIVVFDVRVATAEELAAGHAIE